MNRDSNPLYRNNSQRRRAMICLFTACVYLHVSLALFPHGPEAGDTEITSDRSSLVSLDPAFPFYGLNLSSVMIYRDAFICFDNITRDLYLLEKNAEVNFPAITVWASAVRTRHNGGVGSVTYRFTTNVTLLRQISETTRSFSEFSRTFYPVYAVVITWLDVGTVHFEEVSMEKTNTFQVLLVTDGRQSLVWMEYSKIEWIYDGPVAMYDYNDIVEFTRAQLGFYKGDDSTVSLLPVSFTPRVRDVTTLSNVNIPGVYMFRTDTAPLNLTMYKASNSITSSTIALDDMSTEQTSIATDDSSAEQTSSFTEHTSTVPTPVLPDIMSSAETSIATDDKSTVQTLSSRESVITVQSSTLKNMLAVPTSTTRDLTIVQTSTSKNMSTLQTSTAKKMSTLETSISNVMSTIQTWRAKNMSTIQTWTAKNMSTVRTPTSTDMSTVLSSTPKDTSSVQTPTSKKMTTLQTSTSKDLATVPTTIPTFNSSIVQTFPPGGDTSTVLPSMSTSNKSTVQTSRSSTIISTVTYSTHGDTDHTVPDPIVGMIVVCAVLAVITIVALILVCRLQVKNRRKRFHSRKVGPEEPITAAIGNGQLRSAATQAVPRVQLHSASSVVSSTGIRMVDY